MLNGFTDLELIVAHASRSAQGAGPFHYDHALTHYVEHLHHERNHQGKGNVRLFPTVSQDTVRQGPVQCRERLGGLLKYYEREAA